MRYPALVVVKVGGSLYDLPDLGPRLSRWLQSQQPTPMLLIPGGGLTADVIRELDRVHRLGEATAHELALRSLSLNSYFLQILLTRASNAPRDYPIVTCPSNHDVVLLDVHAFWREQPKGLPACWDATSDSVAAWVAQTLAAKELVLLKSLPLSEPWTPSTLSEAGLVDRLFPRLIGAMPVRWVNLRAND